MSAFLILPKPQTQLNALVKTGTEKLLARWLGDMVSTDGRSLSRQDPKQPGNHDIQ
jgi:hypothetical protein